MRRIRQKAVRFLASLLVAAMTGRWIYADLKTPPRVRATPSRHSPTRAPRRGYDGDSIEIWIDLYSGLRSFAYYDHPACHELLRRP